MSPRTPLLIVGDAPTQPTGLARIARDLADLVADAFAEVDLQFLGWEPAAGSWAGWSGDYPLWRFSDTLRWGAPLVQHVQAVLRAQGNPRAGIVWPIWDASRAYELLPAGLHSSETALTGDWQLWLYPAVDAVDPHGTFGGPAAAAVRRADRVVAYGDWAAGVLSGIRRSPVAGIPHPLAEGWYTAPAAPPEPGVLRLGCVATNQPRKDLDLFFAVVAELRHQRGMDHVVGWLHTDVLTRHWNVAQLLKQYHLEDAVEVTLAAPHTTDTWVRAKIDRCRATVAVGRGEGFGYPIAESLARGVPCVGVDYAGGAELLPPEWRVEPMAFTNEGGGYNLGRPLLSPMHVADRLLAARATADCADQARAWAERYRAVAVLPRWRQWIAEGLREIRRTT